MENKHFTVTTLLTSFLFLHSGPCRLFFVCLEVPERKGLTIYRELVLIKPDFFFLFISADVYSCFSTIRVYKAALCAELWVWPHPPLTHAYAELSCGPRGVGGREGGRVWGKDRPQTPCWRKIGHSFEYNHRSLWCSIKSRSSIRWPTCWPMTPTLAQTYLL